MKLLIISHAFHQKWLWKRWKMLCKINSDLSVTLISPNLWEDGLKKEYSFGEVKKSKSENFSSENFEVITVKMIQSKYFDWFSIELLKKIRKIQPDFIYFIGHHLQDPLVFTIIFSKIFSKKSKIFSFSMRSENPNSFFETFTFKSILLDFHKYLKWKIIKPNLSAIFCHYPGAKNAFRVDGFKKNIYVQTQVGVDADHFKPNKNYRNEMRKKLNLDGFYVFGSISRFSNEKGIIEVLKALPKKGKWKYLLLGSGNSEETLKVVETIRNENIEDNVIMPGFIQFSEMPKYINAIDCGIHFTKTTKNWMETFSIALAQIMSTSVPVIGSSSGSIPYQIGNSELIVNEGNIIKLNHKINQVLNNKSKFKKIGCQLRNRILINFDIKFLTKKFNETLKNDFINKNKF